MAGVKMVRVGRGIRAEVPLIPPADYHPCATTGCEGWAPYDEDECLECWGASFEEDARSVERERTT